MITLKESIHISRNRRDLMGRGFITLAIGSAAYLSWNVVSLIQLLDLASQNGLFADLLENMILDKAVNILFGFGVLLFSISGAQWSKHEQRKILEIDRKIKKMTPKS